MFERQRTVVEHQPRYLALLLPPASMFFCLVSPPRAPCPRACTQLALVSPGQVQGQTAGTGLLHPPGPDTSCARAGWARRATWPPAALGASSQPQHPPRTHKVLPLGWANPALHDVYLYAATACGIYRLQRFFFVFVFFFLTF